MHPEEFREMEALEERHWWFVGKRLLLASMLARVSRVPLRRTLDIGCGTGGQLRTLSGAVGIDSADVALRYCRSKGLTSIVRGNVGELPFRGGCFDACTMLDVLEHVDDDVALLREAARVLV